MKTIILLSLLFSLIHADIEWFNMQNLQKKSANHFIGYGSAKNLNQAKLLAKKDIAQQISLTIKSIDTSRYGRNKEGVSANEFNSSVEQIANVHLELTQTIKVEHEDTFYYVALEYENITFVQRFTKMLHTKKCVPSTQHPYLKQTPIFKQINAMSSCSFDIQMARKNASWGLRYDDIFLRIPRSKINAFYITTKNPIFSVTPSSNKLHNGDVFNFSIETKRDGYLTLFDVYANGIVTVIESNLKVYKNIQTTYPHKKSSLELRAGVLENEEETFDLYVAILADKPLNLSQFTESSDEVETERFHYNIDKLLQLANEHTFSSSLLRIKP